jgi:hypothetical protein
VVHAFDELFSGLLLAHRIDHLGAHQSSTARGKLCRSVAA